MSFISENHALIDGFTDVDEVQTKLDSYDLSKATIEVIDTDIKAKYALDNSETFWLPGHRGDFDVFKKSFFR